MIAALILIPLLAGAAAFALRRRVRARLLLVPVGVTHLALTAACWSTPAAPILGGWVALDAPGLLFLTLASVLFFAASICFLGQLRADAPAANPGAAERQAPEYVFVGCLLVFLSTMTLACVSRHLGLLWVAVEATTLATAPLIYIHRNARALEATWKYLMICSVGIALALLGTFLLAVAAAPAAGAAAPSLVLDALLGRAATLNAPWLKAAFIFLLVGYGTKMGLAPLHTWLPDAHSESPSVVSALLSGALLNCAFLALLRGHQLCVAAGQGAFSAGLLLGFGLFSVAVATVFLIGQPSYKRLLAYSSVEHMGLLAFGVGAGGTAVFGALLHAANHSLAKAALFFTAGGILSAYGTARTQDVRGLLAARPALGALWIAGLFAITGTPPFGMFLSEFTLLKGAFDRGHGWLVAATLALLALAFVGMSRSFLHMAQGEPAPGQVRAALPRAQALLTAAPAAVLLAATLALGLWVPSFLRDLLAAAAPLIGGVAP